MKLTREHGVSRCFRGLLPCVYRDATGFAGYMISFEYLCRLVDPRGPDFCSIPVTLITGGMAGIFSWLINLPIDTIKTRLQADSFSNPRFSGTLNCAATLWRENGIRTFYRGLSAVVGRAFVMNGVTLTVYNVCQYELMQYWRIDDE